MGPSHPNDIALTGGDASPRAGRHRPGTVPATDLGPMAQSARVPDARTAGFPPNAEALVGSWCGRRGLWNEQSLGGTQVFQSASSGLPQRFQGQTGEAGRERHMINTCFRGWKVKHREAKSLSPNLTVMSAHLKPALSDYQAFKILVWPN